MSVSVRKCLAQSDLIAAATFSQQGPLIWKWCTRHHSLIGCVWALYSATRSHRHGNFKETQQTLWTAHVTLIYSHENDTRHIFKQPLGGHSQNYLSFTTPHPSPRHLLQSPWDPLVLVYGIKKYFWRVLLPQCRRSPPIMISQFRGYCPTAWMDCSYVSECTIGTRKLNP